MPVSRVKIPCLEMWAVPKFFYPMLLLCWLFAGVSPAEGAAPEPTSKAEREKKFSAMLSEVTLVGTYTQTGQDKEPKKERYTIYRVTKIPGRAHLWRFDVRIQFGTVDLKLPLPLTVQWAGETPMVVLDDYKIPGLGSFSARVLFDHTRYAGTWQHGRVGGHLFGEIIKEQANKDHPEESGVQ